MPNAAYADDISSRLKTLLNDAGRNLVYYEGSETEPACLQGVSTVVFQNAFSISDAQVDLIRSYLANDTNGDFVGNNRAVQDINGRPFFYVDNYSVVQGPSLGQLA